ncbi:MAG: type II secretion system protein [Candidatus Omnitrophica bacterium]|nr:type II secretion system protein [Candidatus Omnitrophota bacterium]
MKKAAKRGMTFMELIAALVVAGIAIPALLTIWSTASWQAMRSEGAQDALIYAQGLMEEIVSKQFDDQDESPWSTALGRDGENGANASSFNDVDDFINTTDPRIISPAPGYSRWVWVEYVLLNAANTWVVCPSAPVCGAVNNCTTCNECCYKRITVNVQKNNLPANASLTTIVAGY